MAKVKKPSSKTENVVTSDENTLRFPKRSTENTEPVSPRGGWGWHVFIIFAAILVALTPVLIRFDYSKVLQHGAERFGLNKPGTTIDKPTCLKEGLKLFTKEELTKHTKASDRIWLGFLGEVFDVTEGKFYHPGGAYAFFSGVDGTRAFLNGQFVKEELRDDITDLEDSYFTGLDTWLNMYHEKYKHLGYVIGAYYDKNACPTDKLAIIEQKLSKLKEKEQENESERNQYPPCNSEWIETSNRGRLWCTNLSGGIPRSWAGRPRMFYELNNKKWRCACIEDEEAEATLCPGSKPKVSKTSKSGVDYDDEEEEEHGVTCRIKYYPECKAESEECFIRD